MDKEFIKLPVENKISLFNGLNAWETRDEKDSTISSARMSDGPYGIRREKPLDGEGGLAFIEGTSFPSVCYPPACLSACSFDKNLLYEYGNQLALEARNLNVDLILGPGVNIKRSPLCGRNFEYFSEDPYLSGVLASYMINGIQDKHVGACIKHFALNNQETNRFISSSNANKDVMQEIYLKPFEIAIKNANPYSLMCSYNKVNGIYGSENPYLLKNILREKWHYEGMVVSDWGATNNLVDSFKNGLNLEMPGGDKGEVESLLEAYKKKIINDEDVNNATYPVYHFNQKARRDRTFESKFNEEEAFATALKVAEESIVLTKNENNILPLKNKNVLVLGELAKNMHYQGGGSSHINSIKVVQPLDALAKQVNATYYDAYSIKEDHIITEETDLISKSAKACDAVIVFIGTFNADDSEGYDRNNMNVRSYMIDLIKNVHSKNQNIICVIQCGAPIDLREINKYCKAILISYMPGCMGGQAISNILLGQTNPSGRLAETWPLSLEDTALGNTYPTQSRDVLYTEGFLVGYRYYNFVNKEVFYPFGHGLSYSQIEYSEFELSNKKIKFKIENKSDILAKEVIQIYISHSANPTYKELKYFDKVKINPNSNVIIEINLTEDMFLYFNEETEEFQNAKGTYYLHVCKNSKEELFSGMVFESDGFEMKEKKLDDIIEYKKEDEQNKKGHYTLNTRIIDINNSFIGKIVYKIILSELKKQTNGDNDAFVAMKKQVDYTPIRGMLLAPGSVKGMSRQFLLGLVDILNGHILRGIKKLK